MSETPKAEVPRSDCPPAAASKTPPTAGLTQRASCRDDDARQPLASSIDGQIRTLTAIRLKATAALQLQMAVALIGEGRDTLRKHFQDSAELMLESAALLVEARS